MRHDANRRSHLTNRNVITVSVCISQSSALTASKGIAWARGYKTFFVLNSVEHEISNAHKYKNIKTFSICQAQIRGEGYFFCS